MKRGHDIEPRLSAAPLPSAAGWIDTIFEHPRGRNCHGRLSQKPRLRPSGNIGAQTNLDAVFQRPSNGEDCVAEVRIGQRAMSDAGLRMTDEIEIGVTKMIAVSQHRSRL